MLHYQLAESFNNVNGGEIRNATDVAKKKNSRRTQ